MKKKLLLYLIFLINIFAFSNLLFAQKAGNSIIEQAIDRVDTTKKSELKDTIIADRDIIIDAEKLCKIATLSVYSTPNAANGLVILRISFNEIGEMHGINVDESENSKLNVYAFDAIKTYAKKYGIVVKKDDRGKSVYGFPPAIRNGKPVKVQDMFIPVLFDLSLFK